MWYFSETNFRAFTDLLIWQEKKQRQQLAQECLSVLVLPYFALFWLRLNDRTRSTEGFQRSYLEAEYVPRSHLMTVTGKKRSKMLLVRKTSTQM